MNNLSVTCPYCGAAFFVRTTMDGWAVFQCPGCLRHVTVHLDDPNDQARDRTAFAASKEKRT